MRRNTRSDPAFFPPWSAAIELEAERVSLFLGTIGIFLRWTDDPVENTFLPDIRIERGCRIVARRRHARMIGDALHEAGHLAVTPSLFRPMADHDTDALHEPMQQWLDQHPDAFHTQPEHPVARAILQSGEQEAIAWSHAAAVHLGLSPEHRFTYGRTDEPTAAEIAADVHHALTNGAHPGIHGLAAAGFCDLPRRGPHPFPLMRRWLAV